MAIRDNLDPADRAHLGRIPTPSEMLPQMFARLRDGVPRFYLGIDNIDHYTGGFVKEEVSAIIGYGGTGTEQYQMTYQVLVWAIGEPDDT